MLVRSCISAENVKALLVVPCLLSMSSLVDIDHQLKSWFKNFQEKRKGAVKMSKVVRTYEQECGFVEQVDATSYRINMGFVENMRVPGHFYVNNSIRDLLFEELRQFSRSSGTAGQFSGAVGGFLPAMKQIANVAALPGIVGRFV